MSDTEAKRLDTFYLVEATHNESHTLWLEWADEARVLAAFRGRHRIDWKQDSCGYFDTVGFLRIKRRTKIEKAPVCVSVFWATIAGKRIGFYEATSQVVDHRMVAKWLKKEFPNAKGKVNAANFHNCVHAIEREDAP